MKERGGKKSPRTWRGLVLPQGDRSNPPTVRRHHGQSWTQKRKSPGRKGRRPGQGWDSQSQGYAQYALSTTVRLQDSVTVTFLLAAIVNARSLRILCATDGSAGMHQ